MQSDYTIQYYFIVYVDLLNQTELLKSIDDIDINSANSHELHVEALRKTVGTVKDFYNAFYDSMDLFFKKIDNLNERNKYIKRYSDSIILYLPLKSIDVEPIQILLDTLCDFLFCTLSESIPCRGSIEIGKGVEIEVNDNEIQIYGPVLAKAVELEKKASYPSIVLSNDVVMKYIPPTFIDKYLYFEDNFFRINFLAESVKANSEYGKCFEKLKIFISDSIKKYKNDEKLFNRYKKLERRLFA